MPHIERRKEPEVKRIMITTGSFVRGVIVIAVALALFYIRDLVLVFLASIVIASAIEPIAGWAKQQRIPRVLAILGLYAITAILFAGVFYFLFLPLLSDLSSFIRSFPEYSRAFISSPGLSDISGSSSFFGNVSGSIPVSDIVNRLNTFVVSISDSAFSSVSIVFGGVFSFILMVVLSFYLAVQEDGVGKFLRIITPWKQEEYVVSLWSRSQAKIGLWMQGQLLLAVIIMVLVYLGLLLLGVEQALLLAAAAGLLEIIPLFGPIIASIPAIIIAYAGGGTTLAILVTGLFLIIHQFENQLIYPLVVKKVVGVPPMLSIIALLVGGALGGFLGLVISVPMATILMEYINDLEQEKVARVSALSKTTDE